MFQEEKGLSEQALILHLIQQNDYENLKEIGIVKANLNFLEPFSEIEVDAKISPLICACYLGRLEIVRLLLQNICLDVDLGSEDSGWTPLTVAANTGNYEIMKLLVDAQAEVNKPNGFNHTPLVCCFARLEEEKNVFENRKICMKMAELLLHYGADIDWIVDKKHGFTLLMQLCANKLDQSQRELDNNFMMIKFLVENGVFKLNIQIGKKRFSFLERQNFRVINESYSIVLLWKDKKQPSSIGGINKIIGQKIKHFQLNFMLLFVLLQLTLQFQYQFQGVKRYLLIQVFSSEWEQMQIMIFQNGSKLAQISSQYDQYLELYYSIKAQQYNFDIQLYPATNYTIKQMDQITCPNNCSGIGQCFNSDCVCPSMYTGERCQYQVQTKNTLKLLPKETQVLTIIIAQQDFKDRSGTLRNFFISSNQTIQCKIYFLLPYSDYSLSSINQIYNDFLGTKEQLKYQPLFQNNALNSAQFQFILVLSSYYDQEQYIQISYEFQDVDQGFNDFILVAILSVVGFIIILIIIYVVRRRCQYIDSNKMKCEEPESQNSVIQQMQIVYPAKELECVICLDTLETKQCRMTGCKHIIHEECLKQWFIKQQNCPICRDSFVEGGYLNPKMTIHHRQGISGSTIIVASDRNSVRQMILQRSRQSQLGVYQ
ncbi:hypothetical protein pb186bvf_018442 [Paramecium bursaria]